MGDSEMSTGLTRRSFLVGTPFLVASSVVRADGAVDAAESMTILPTFPAGGVSASRLSPDDETLAIGVGNETGAIDVYTISLSRPDKFVLWCTIPGADSIHSLSWSPPPMAPEIALAVRFLKGVGAENQIVTAKRGKPFVTRFVLSRERVRVSRSGGGGLGELLWTSTDEFCFPSPRGIKKVNTRTTGWTTLYSPETENGIDYGFSGMRLATPRLIEFAEIDAANFQLTGNAKIPSLVQVSLDDGSIRRTALRDDSFGLVGPLFSNSSYAVGPVRLVTFKHGKGKTVEVYRPLRVYSRDDNKLIKEFSEREKCSLLPVAFSSSGSRLVCFRVIIEGVNVNDEASVAAAVKLVVFHLD